MSLRTKGKVKGNTIVLEEPLDLPDGTEVEVSIKHPITRGKVWKDRNDLDDLLKEIYESRISKKIIEFGE